MRIASKRDANEEEIVVVLLAVGASVVRLNIKHVADLAVGYRGKNYLLEVKMPTGRLSTGQSVWHGTWQGKVDVVRSVADALSAIGCENS